jgi:GNAT superfamily N-acetyltransferase
MLSNSALLTDTYISPPRARQRLNGVAKLRLDYLSNHPEVLPILKEWFETEWASYYGPEGRGDAQTDLATYANGTNLPVGVVAFLNNEICGIAVLKSESIKSHSQLSPWAAAAMVHRNHRGRGIGTELIRAVEDEAKRHGYKEIYCGTSTATRLLERAGWRLMEQVLYDGENVSIYAKAL